MEISFAFDRYAASSIEEVLDAERTEKLKVEERIVCEKRLDVSCFFPSDSKRWNSCSIFQWRITLKEKEVS